MSGAPSPGRRSSWVAGGLMILAAFFAILFLFAYWGTRSTPEQGASLGLSFACITVGLVIWAKRDLPQGPYEESYSDLRAPARSEAEVLAKIDRGHVGRRKFLLGALGLAGGSIAAGAVSAVRSLGPGAYFYHGSPWGPGKRLVTTDGTPVHAADIPLDSYVVVFPEGFIDSPVAPANLIRIPPGRNHPDPGRASWDPGGFICYSRICTHAGCSVAQYDALSFQLQCPCHQSTFDVLEGAKPVFGPATRALPQLPVVIDPDGTFRAAGPLSGPPGPSYWHYT